MNNIEVMKDNRIVQVDPSQAKPWFNSPKTYLVILFLLISIFLFFLSKAFNQSKTSQTTQKLPPSSSKPILNQGSGSSAITTQQKIPIPSLKPVSGKSGSIFIKSK